MAKETPESIARGKRFNWLGPPVSLDVIEAELAMYPVPKTEKDRRLEEYGRTIFSTWGGIAGFVEDCKMKKARGDLEYR